MIARSIARYLLAVGILAGSAMPSVGAPVFGMIQGKSPNTDLAVEYKRAGVKSVVVELYWMSYEPTRGEFDAKYVRRTRQVIDALRGSGFQVCLEPGLHCCPDWVFRVSPSARFVNQYGETWRTDQFGNDVPNAVFDPEVRKAQASYIARIAKDFGDIFPMIRCGGLGYGELRYPRNRLGERTNCYWCFDANAQAGSPVPGWRPGDLGSARARRFVDYYLDSLKDYQNWLVGQWRSRFPKAHLMVLYPSWGLRPGDIDAAVANRLDGSTSPEINSEFAMGTDFARQISSLRDRNVWAYCTWLERPDEGAGHKLQSPVEYISFLARQKRIPVAGENSGDNDASQMKLCGDRVRKLPMAAMFWMSERQLGTGTNATLQDYAKVIAESKSAN